MGVGHVLAAKGQVGHVLGTQAGGAGFIGAYDAFSPVHVYEIGRRTLTSYTGNLVELRHSGTGATQSFGYLADGELDKAAIAAWLGGADGYVRTIYDQGAAGDNVIQTDTNRQPLYVASAQNGHAGLSLDGGDKLTGAFVLGGALSQPFNVFTIVKTNNVALVVNAVDGDDIGTNRMAVYQTGRRWAIYAGVEVRGNFAINTNYNLLSCLFNGASSELWANGVSQRTGNVGAQNADGIIIGAFAGGAYWQGYILNTIICDPSLSDANRIAMQTAINNFWAVY